MEVAVTDGMLILYAERTEQEGDGILTVRVPLDKPVKAASHKIKVASAK